MSKEVSSWEQSLKFALKTEVEQKNLLLFFLCLGIKKFVWALLSKLHELSEYLMMLGMAVEYVM